MLYMYVGLYSTYVTRFANTCVVCTLFQCLLAITTQWIQQYINRFVSVLVSSKAIHQKILLYCISLIALIVRCKNQHDSFYNTASTQSYTEALVGN